MSTFLINEMKKLILSSEIGKVQTIYLSYDTVSLMDLSSSADAYTYILELVEDKIVSVSAVKTYFAGSLLQSYNINMVCSSGLIIYLILSLNQENKCNYIRVFGNAGMLEYFDKKSEHLSIKTYNKEEYEIILDAAKELKVTAQYERINKLISAVNTSIDKGGDAVSVCL